MANHDDNEEATLDMLTNQFHLGQDLLQATFETARIMGIQPSAWILALTSETAFVAYIAGRRPGVTDQEAIDSIVDLFRETLETTFANPPRRKTAAESAVSIQAIRITDAKSEDPMKDLVDSIISKAVKP